MKYKVFLIDDEIWMIRGMLKAIPWENLGFEVIFYTTDSSEIFEKIESLNPDLILTDIRMPLVSGLDILHYCNKKKEKPEIVLISAYEEFSYARDALKYGAVDYLVKPIKNTNLIELLLRVKTILGEKKKTFYRDIEKEILEKKIDITPEKLFSKIGYEKVNNSFCVLSLAKKYFGMNQSVSVLSKIFQENKVIIRSEQFVYFILNSPAEKIISNTEIIHTLKEYMLYVGLSQTFVEGEILCTYIRQASCAALQFLISQTEVVSSYSKIPKLPHKNDYYRLLQRAFAENNGDIILQQIRILQEEKNCNIGDIVGLGNYISINLNRKEDFGKYGITRLDQFLERYQSIGDYYDALEFVVCENFGDVIDQQLDIKKVKIYIQEHYMECEKVKEIAEHFHVEVGYLGRAFKKAYDINMKDYIVELKIEKAKYLLTSTNRKIYEISEMVGYGDYFYFARVFRNMTGETPSDYRKNAQVDRKE